MTARTSLDTATPPSAQRSSTPATSWLWLLAAYSLAHVVLWQAIPSLIGKEPPTDNLEQLSWAEHLAWGYDKHPPLPTIVLWLFEQVFPPSVHLTYALGGLQIAALLFLVWWITRQVLDERRAIVAVLLVSCVTYYTRRLHFYNHNTGLLVAYALSVACVLKAVRTGRLHWYVLLGVAWAAGLLSKYQMVVGIACNGFFVMWMGRRQLRKPMLQLAVAAAVCAILVIPHVSWLVDHGFPSFTYAARFVAAHLPWWQRPADVAGFLLDQAMRLAPLAVWLCLLTRLPVGRAPEVPGGAMRDRFALAGALLAVHAWGPLAFMCSLSILFGTNLEMHWGTAFLWMLPIWFLRTGAGLDISALPLKIVFVSIAILQVLMLASYR